MNYEQVRQVMAKLGFTVPTPNDAGWTHIGCPFAPWRHGRGTDRSKGFAIKVEPDGISAFKCPSCGAHGRISQIPRSLSALRNDGQSEHYETIARQADEYDLLGSKLPTFDDQFSPEADIMEPLDEEAFSGLFEQIADHKPARRFMYNRRVTRATCEKLRLEYDAEKKRIVFPVRDGLGRLFGWSGRTVIPDHDPKVLDYAGLPKRSLILGEERWRPNMPKLLVEGLIGYARMHEIGVEEIADIGALLGSTLTEEKAAILKHHGCAVIQLVDPDEAGDKCLFGQWALEKVDPDTGEVTAPGHHVGGGLIDVLASEVPVLLPLYPQGVSDVDDLTFEQVEHMVRTAELQGISQAWLDKKSKVG